MDSMVDTEGWKWEDQLEALAWERMQKQQREKLVGKMKLLFQNFLRAMPAHFEIFLNPFWYMSIFIKEDSLLIKPSPAWTFENISLLLRNNI